MEYNRNYVQESSQNTHWHLTEAKLAEYVALKDQKYKAYWDKIKNHEKKAGLRRDNVQIVEAL